jgi:hypothetical protein
MANLHRGVYFNYFLHSPPFYVLQNIQYLLLPTRCQAVLCTSRSWVMYSSVFRSPELLYPPQHGLGHPVRPEASVRRPQSQPDLKQHGLSRPLYGQPPSGYPH